MTTVEFGALFHFIRNGMNVKQDKSGEGLPITRIETISDAVVDAVRVGYAGLTEDQCRNWLLEPGDILLSHINSVDHIGKCAVYRGQPAKLVHGMNLLCLRSDPTKLLPEFAKYLIRSGQFRSRLANSIKKAVNQASVSIGDLKAIPVALPPLPEQRRIAEVLDRAEALRAKRRAALAQLDTLTQAIFLDMFGDPATNPKGWPKKMLAELISVGPQNGLYKPVGDYGSGTPILRIDAFYDGMVTKLASLKRVRISDEEQTLYGLHPGEIVINRVNSREYLGKSAVIPVLSEPTVFESNVMRFDVYREAVDPGFLIQYLQTGFVREHILRSAKDAINQSSINQQDVKALPVFVPPMAVQQLFTRRLDSTARLDATHRDSLTELNALFASLQHRAFRGEL